VFDSEGRQAVSVSITDRAPQQEDGIYPVATHRRKYSLIVVGAARFQDLDADTDACSNARKNIRDPYVVSARKSHDRDS
jgi:hypothetical protein